MSESSCLLQIDEAEYSLVNLEDVFEGYELRLMQVGLVDILQGGVHAQYLKKDNNGTVKAKRADSTLQRRHATRSFLRI